MGYFRFIKLNLRPNRDIIIYINTSKEGIKMRYLKSTRVLKSIIEGEY